MFQHVLALILSEKFKTHLHPTWGPTPKPLFFIKDARDYKPINFKETIHVDESNFLHILKQDKLEKNLILNSFFQVKEFIEDYKQDILSCFDLKPEKREGTFIHYRLDDLWCPTKIDYFRKCIELMDNQKPIYISSDSMSHDWVQTLIKEFNLIPYLDSPEKTIFYGSSFENRILSMGTFSWWIGFLNEGNIYYPDPVLYGAWHGPIFPAQMGVDWSNWHKISI